MIHTEFLITALIVVLIPGTGVIYTVSTALFSGFRAGVAAAIGCTAGIIPHLLASVLGLSAVLHMSALVFQVIKFAGALYLLYLAWGMWRETGSLAFEERSEGRGMLQTALRGFLINILNPKLTVFFLAFLPLFIVPDEASPLSQLFLLSAAFMGMTLVVFVLYGAFAHAVRRHVANAPGVMRRAQRMFAVMFAAMGIKLALSER